MSSLWMRLSPYREFLRFVLVGVINTAISYGLYLLFLLFLNYTLAYSIAYILGIFIAYYLNTRFVFKVEVQLSKALQYPIVYAVQYLLGILLLRTLVEWLAINRTIAPIIVIGASIPITFVLSRFILKRNARLKPEQATEQ